MLNLDTHVLVHALAGELRPAEERLLVREPWSISAIVLWEIEKLRQLGRLTIDAERLERAVHSVHVWPIDLAVARASTRLDFRSDPADELIAATSMVHGAALVTRDRKMLRSKLVPLAR